MSENKRHALEPWRLGGDGKSGQLLSAKGGVIANWGAGGIDARRIVACVNACAGIPTEALEAGELGKALKALVAVYEGRSAVFSETLRALGRLP